MNVPNNYGNYMNPDQSHVADVFTSEYSIYTTLYHLQTICLKAGIYACCMHMNFQQINIFQMSGINLIII